MGDHPPPTQRTDDTELGERIGLKAPVEIRNIDGEYRLARPVQAR
jgi:hypothetical protein